MKPTTILAASLLGLAAATIPTGTAIAQNAATTCLVHVHPWDDMSRRLEVVHADGSTQVLLSVQDNRTTLGGPQTFEVDATVTEVRWVWVRASSSWKTVLDVAPGCQMEPYPYWQGGEHPPSISMSVGQVVTTTTTAAPTTTTAAQVTTTTAPTTSTTAAPPPATTTTAPQPLTTLRTTPIPAACAADACQPALTRAPRLPETGRRTWPQVRLSLGLLAVGVAALQLARVMQQDEELEG